jgi:tetratricopeptide (TPR) repeat protein
MPLAPGTRIGPYEITATLGSGGMGDVYRADDTRLHRPVALKFLSPTRRDDPESRARLLNEARAASALRSPSVAVTYDLGEHDGAIFIVMEYVEGETIAHRLERGPLPVADALSIAMQVADALDEAHGRGIVHRDIKSANLIQTPRNVAKVLDFGLAKILELRQGAADDAARARLTFDGAVLGTVSYMSPEQALGRAIDGRSDLFSLGVVLFEMLTAYLPFAGSTAVEIVDQILHRPPLPLGRFLSPLPPGLDAVVERALEKEPRFRHQTARELYLDLRSVRRALEGPAERQSAIRPPLPSSKAGAVVGNASAPASAVAVLTFVNITREPADDWIGTGIAETVTADLKNVPGLGVIGRARVFEAVKNLSFGEIGRFDDALAIDVGRRLGAAWVVGGGYQRQGQAIRITAQFVDVQTGAVLRTVKVDGTIDEIFALQDKIVYELSQGLHLTVGEGEKAEIERAETRSVAAYESYSRGMMNLRLASRDALDRAMSLLDRATRQDPGYAAAWAALGLAYNLKGNFLGLPELVQQAVEFERRALALDAKLASAHLWLGSAFLNLGRPDEAIPAIREALRLEPGNASAHAWLARAHWVGRGEIDAGIHELEQAVALNAEAGYSYLQLSLLYSLRGRYADADRAARQAIDLQEQYISGNEGLLVIGAHARLGHVFYLQGRYDDAIKEYERELAFLSSSDHALKDRTIIELQQKLGAAFLRRGDAERAARHLHQAIKAHAHRVAEGADDPATRYYVAGAHALLGDTEQALECLERSSVRLRALNAARAPVDPDLEPLRGHPRFEALVRAS